MNELGEYYVRWDKWDRKTDTVRYHLYMVSKKYSQLVTKTEKKQTHRENKQEVTSGGQRVEKQCRGEGGGGTNS